MISNVCFRKSEKDKIFFEVLFIIEKNDKNNDISSDAANRNDCFCFRIIANECQTNQKKFDDRLTLKNLENEMQKKVK